MRATSVDMLSDDLRQRLHALLTQPGVTHRQIADEINAGAGESVISKSSVSRYSKRMDAIAQSDRQAALVADRYLATIGEEGKQKLGQASLHLVKAVVFDVSQTIREIDRSDPDALDQVVQMIGRIARALRDLESASKTGDERRRAIRDELAAAAEEVEETARSGGLSDETAKAIGERVLGISID